MVSPIYIFIIALSLGFLLALLDKLGRKITYMLFFGALGFFAMLCFNYLLQMINGASPIQVYTAGFKPPFSINLTMGLYESFVLTVVNLMALFSAFYMMKTFFESKISFMILYLMFIMGINGLVMTRDIFNLFVFLEITSIALYGLLASKRDSKSVSAGFKYIIAGGLASTFFLVGVAFVYRLTGNLSLDFMLGQTFLLKDIAGLTAVFLIIISLIIELKPFPANGWALDVYETALPGIAANIAVVSSAGMIFALYKLLPFLPPKYWVIIAGIGLTTFVASNLMGLKQINVKRMLGYSSIAQMGLLMAAMAYMNRFGFDAKQMFLVLGGLFINHFLAKAGLFWIVGIVKKDDYRNWGLLSSAGLLLSLGVFIFALIGLPPFPGFFAKWTLLTLVANSGHYVILAAVLIGSLLEAAYLLKWFGFATRNQYESSKPLELQKLTPIMLFAFALFIFGILMSYFFGLNSLLKIAPLAVPIFFYLLRKLPAKVKGFLVIGVLSIQSYFIYPKLSGIYCVFAWIFLFGSIILTIATMYKKDDRRVGFFASLLLMLMSLNNLLISTTTFELFLFWELMTLGSYFLVLRGKNALKPAHNYIVWLLSGSFSLLAGLVMLSGGQLNFLLWDSSRVLDVSTWAYVLMTIGFLIKVGTIGVWIPTAHSEAEDDISAFLSAILLKAGVFGFVLITLIFGAVKIGNIEFMTVLGWMGVLTSVMGALLAVYQEDVKKMMAYSSVSQLGMILLAFSIFSHSGLITGLYLTVNHSMIKILIFLAIAGVVYRTNTRYMYQMGGLIKKMPATFITALMAIIAVSGVPPLTGFGGKWLLYVSLLEKGWVLQAGLAFFASGITFLYLFRFIHTIFLGQLKTKHRDIKEAPLWLIIPQYIVICLIMAVSTYPTLLIKPLHDYAAQFFTPSMQIQGNTIVSSLGYWNGTSVMVVTMIIFGTLFGWLLLINHRSKKIGQLNIVYAAERPDRPETTHFAYNFYAHYKKALGIFAKPHATIFWDHFADSVHTIANVLRQLYTGNGQTYAIHILLFIGVVYMIFRGI